MGMENFFGKMEEYIEVIGKMANKVEEAFIEMRMELKEKGSGKMGLKLDGLILNIERMLIQVSNIQLYN